MTKRWLLMMVVVAALLSAASTSFTQSREELREEFHATFALAQGGRIALENINGDVRIQTWERNEVKVDAVKRAYIAERLKEADIKVDATPDAVRIKTQYPHSSNSWTRDEEGRRNNPASVDYTLTVPRSARLDGVNLINGALNIENLSGDVDAASVNGRLTARGLSGRRVRLSVINGRLEAAFDNITDAQSITLSSVNGGLALTLPSDANAEVRASTVHGPINNDFGLPVRRGEHVGRDLAGQLGRGGARIKLQNVNGSISLKHAADGRPLSPATNLLSEVRESDPDVDVDDVNNEVAREAQRAASEIQREVAEAAREAAREAEAATRELRRENPQLSEEEMRRIRQEALKEADKARKQALEQHRETIKEATKAHKSVTKNETKEDKHIIERESKSFTINGSSRVRIETFDGPISIRAWDKPEVMFTAVKRARDDREMKGIMLTAEQTGTEVAIVAKFDKAHSHEAEMRGDRVVSFVSSAAVELDVYVPRESIVRAISGDGRMRVEGVRGELDLRTGDGPVDVNEGGGRLRVSTGDGRIRVVAFDGEADARTGDGRITLEGNFTKLSARTGEGSISLMLPASTNAVIETNAERVISDGFAVAEENGETGRRVRRWRIGQGGNVFTVQTGEGEVVVRQQE